MEEEFEGHHVQDVLSGISVEMQESAPEFEFYREVHRNQDRILEFILENSNDENASSFERKAWDLDKWKFLPSVQRALQSKPDAKWFVFIEGDTFLVWSNLLDWLAHLDWREPYFLGLPVTMEDQLFAYGGSGWVLSRAAIQQVTRHMAPLMDHYEDFTNRSSYGDLILGHIAEQSGLQLTDAWPLIQRETPSTMEYTKGIWCHPVVTFHHVDAKEIKEIWDLEQEIIAVGDEHEVPPPILHFDVFNHLVYPHLSARIYDWDNFSDGEERTLDAAGDEGFEGCKRYCEEDTQCVQFRSTPKKCTLSRSITLGWEADWSMSSTSGWMMERIDSMKASVSCEGGKWDIDSLDR
ncbi:hypothetical protein BJX63DRAFT_425971 [Aspergillus granulosus]|uniref:N-acetylgalactosaminide beta-1,3-galactosyltransferase n=1 Tax=Aspergillus granulosus TaxID=176169 RepID=A0ABR4GUF8_9EURO